MIRITISYMKNVVRVLSVMTDVMMNVVHARRPSLALRKTCNADQKSIFREDNLS